MQGIFMGKKFILNADDFGIKKGYNKAVLEGYNNGFLMSASICANGEAFSAAVNDILPECPGIGLGVHLNIIEGKSLTKCRFLTNKNGQFNKGYLYFILNSHKKAVLEEIEQEFRAQIEKVNSYTAIDHLDSHVHTHAIPEIFNITCKLAKEYKIPFVRTQKELPYMVPSLKKHLNLSYPLNVIKILILNTFTQINKKTLADYDLKTNDYLLGVGYTGMMDAKTIEYGLKNIDKDAIVEALIHPCASAVKNSHSEEFSLTLDKNLEYIIKQSGYEITNYKNLSL